MWWAAFAVVNWLGVVYLKERGPKVLQPSPSATVSPYYILLVSMYGLAIFGMARMAWKWIKKKV